MTRVAVNGYGVIGRRVADAIQVQPDMELIGVTKVKPDYRAVSALRKGFKVYAIDDKSRKNFQDAGVACHGLAKELFAQADIIIDSTPEETGAQNKILYEQLGKKAIFQGGEEHELTGFSFVAQCNYAKAKGRDFVRVVSCNSTALCRVLGSLDSRFGVSKANVVIARRAADPDESGKGPIDAVVLDPASIPSHHGPDVNSVLPDFPVISMAMKIPTTHMHLHSLIASVRDGEVSEEKVIEQLSNNPRIMFVTGKKEGFKSTANIMDLAREMGRPRNDIYECVIWKDSIKVVDDEVYLFMAVHQEAIVTPENIDAVRAMTGLVGQDESIELTNKTLGIPK